MAEYLVLIACFMILAAFLALFALIFNLGVLERRLVMGEPSSPFAISEQPKVGVQNPFNLKICNDGSTDDDDYISVMLRSTISCYVTFYWGVPIQSIEALIYKEETNRLTTDEDCFLPVHRLLREYQDKSTSEYYEKGQDHQIKEHIPSELEHDYSSNYQVVIAAEWLGNFRQSNDVDMDPCEIVSLLAAFKYKQLNSGKKKFVLAAQYIQIANGRIYSLKKLYINSDSAQDNSQIDENSEPTSSCVVCQSMPVSRVLLPCRHACVCGMCFSKLNFKCPLCRQWIHSYFLTQEEPEFTTNDLDTSRQLHDMTIGEIVRGIFTSG